ncbi:MAG TPA: MBL fold metallo-hydrolase [Solirubrobacteraceae bacterium]|nr:MBL fold metallo-hydrolase [Solirubrobacteraceae bacterium]
MRVLALHPDVLLATSAIWQTNCVIVRGVGRPAADVATDLSPSRLPAMELSASGPPATELSASGPPAMELSASGPPEETFVIDSPVLPEELEALPALLEQARFPAPSGLLATHADWDHLLGRLAFPDAALGCAESTVARLQASPGEAQRELREFDREFYVERPGPLMLGSIQALPVPGRCALGHRELELHAAPGHTADGMAIGIPWAGVLVAGDYLSAVEPPKVETGGSADAYRATLERLRPLVAAAERIVPGHGPPIGPEQALAAIEQSLAALS